MADNTNAIDIVVTDSVDAGIAPKLIAIADAGDTGTKSLKSLNEQLKEVNSSGLTGLLAQLNSVGSGTGALATSQSNLTTQVKATSAAVRAETLTLAEARLERDKLRAENAGVAISEQATQAQWNKSAIASERAAAAQTGLSEARARDTELQGLSEAVSLAVTGQLERQAVAQEANTVAVKQKTAAMLADESVEDRAIARWNASIAAQERQEAAQLALSAARERDAELQVFASQIADALSLQLGVQAAATEAVTVAENARTEALQAQTAFTSEQIDASTTLSSQNELEAAAYVQLAEATNTASAAKAVLTQLRRDIAAGGIAEQEATTLVAAALLEERTATEQLTLAKANLVEVQQFLNGATAEYVAVEQRAAAAASSTVSANVSAAAGMGILEGRTLSMNRAAANFVTKILGLGPILQQAFVVIGAVALIAVLYQAIEAFDKFINKALDAGNQIGRAFDSIIDPLRKTNDSLAVTNDKLDQTIAKLEHKPTSNGAVLALDQAREAADRLDTELEKVNNELDKILNKNHVGEVASFLTGIAGTGETEKAVKTQFDAIAAAKDNAANAIQTINDTQKAALAAADLLKNPTDRKNAEAAATAAASTALNTAYTAERAAINNTITSLNEQWNAKKKLQDLYDETNRTKVSTPDAPFGANPYQDQTADLTILGKSVKLAKEDLRGLDETMANIQKNSVVDSLRDHASELKVAAKEAAKEWKALEAAYVAFQDSITRTGHKPTPQQDLGFLQSKEPTINPLNRDKLAAKEQPLKNTIAGQVFGDNEIAKLQQQADNMGLYGTALREATEADRIFQEAKQKEIPLTDTQIAKITQLVGYINQHKALQIEETKIQKEATAQEQLYQTALAASAVVMRDHPELAEAISRDVNKMKIAHDDFIDPLLEVNRGIADQRTLLHQYGDELVISQQVQRLANELRAKGVTNYQEEAEAQRANLTQLKDENDLHTAGNAIYLRTVDAIDKLRTEKQALSQATLEEMSNEAKQAQLAQLNAQINDKQLETGKETSSSAPFTGALADYLKAFTTVAAGIKQVYAGVFKTLADGFADSIGRAIVYAQNLGQALKDVARSAISELISGLIKIGIQYLILLAMKKLFGQKDDASSASVKQMAVQTAAAITAMASITAAGLLSASLLSAAWWPVAEAVSLASFGANAIPAAVGIGSVQAIGQIASAPKLATGTNYVPQDMLAVIHQGEAVVPKAYNPAAGGTPQQRGGFSAPKMSVVVEDHTSGAKIQVVQTSDEQIRIVARDVAVAAVENHAPGVVANHIADPNSRISKSLSRNVTPARVR